MVTLLCKALTREEERVLLYWTAGEISSEYEELQIKIKQEFWGEVTLFHRNIANSSLQRASTGLEVKNKQTPKKC